MSRGAWLLAALTVTAVVAVTVAELPGGQSSTGTDAVRLGPTDGQAVTEYVEASAAELATRARESPERASYALITFSDYRTPADLAGVATGVETVRAIVRVPLPRVQTAVLQVPAVGLPADVLSGMRAEARQLRERAAPGTDEVSAAVALAQADPLEAGCACVYALVARGTASELLEVSGRDGVRVVQLAPPERALDRLAFSPLLPEQTVVVGPPPDDGAGELLG